MPISIKNGNRAFSGNWFESQYRQGGKVFGAKTSNGVIEAEKSRSDTITALLTVRTKGQPARPFVMDSTGERGSSPRFDRPCFETPR